MPAGASLIRTIAILVLASLVGHIAIEGSLFLHVDLISSSPLLRVALWLAMPLLLGWLIVTLGDVRPVVAAAALSGLNMGICLYSMVVWKMDSLWPFAIVLRLMWFLLASVGASSAHRRQPQPA